MSEPWFVGFVRRHAAFSPLWHAVSAPVSLTVMHPQGETAGGPSKSGSLSESGSKSNPDCSTTVWMADWAIFPARPSAGAGAGTRPDPDPDSDPDLEPTIMGGWRDIALRRTYAPASYGAMS